MKSAEPPRLPRYHPPKAVLLDLVPTSLQWRLSRRTDQAPAEPWCPPASCSHSQKELGVHFVLFWGYRDNSFQKPPAHLPDMLVPRHYPATHWPLSWGAQKRG